MARILVVDDDPDILKMADRILGQAQYEVFVAVGAVQALELLNSAPFDALISDANMPQYSGFDLVQTIKGNRRFQHMAIAMLTGLREKKDIEKAVRVGVDDYIVKPIEPALLVRKVEGLFRKKPPLHQDEVVVPEGSPQSHATLQSPIAVRKISESGLVIDLDQDLPVGCVLNIDSPLFRSLKLSPLSLRVLSCKKKKEEEEFEAHLGFVNPQEEVLQRIRSYVNSNKHRSAS